MTHPLSLSHTSRSAKFRNSILYISLLILLLLTTGARSFQPSHYDFPNPYNVSASTGLPYKITIEWQVACDGMTDNFEILSRPAGNTYWTVAGRQEVLGCGSGYTYDWDFILDGYTQLAYRNYEFKIATCPETRYWCNTEDDSSEIVTGSGIFSPPYINATDGTYGNRVEISFFEYEGFNSRNYNVYRSTSPTGTYTEVGYTYGDGTNDGIYEDYAVTPGTIYYYKGEVCNAYGCSELSTNYAEGYAATSVTWGVDASDGTEGNYIGITWNEYTPNNGYRVYRTSTDTAPTDVDIYYAEIYSEHYEDYGADPYTTYYYWLRAYDTDIGDWSNISDPDTGWRPYETAYNVNASDGVYYNRVDITWGHDDEEVDYYVIYRSTSSDSSTAESIGSSLTQSYSDNTGLTGTIYNYWIKSCDFYSRCGALTSSDTGYSLVNDTENIAASDGTSTAHVAVTWDPTNAVAEYNVYRHNSNVATPTNVIATVTDAEEYLDTSATPGRTYYYWVEGCGDDYCNDLTNNDTGWRALTAPANLSATDGTDTSQVIITWDSAAGAEYYEVWRATSSTGTKTRIEDSTTSLFFNDTSAAVGTTYYYWATVCTAANGCSDYSNEDTGWRGINPPAGLTASDGQYDQIFINWNDVPGMTHYILYRAETETGTKTSLGAVIPSQYTDTSLTPGQTYYYWAVAANGPNRSDYSAYDTGWMRGGTLPVVDSITRVNASPTNAANVSFLVTFNKDVNGVDSTDFDLTTSGLSGASINSVTGSGSTRTVSVYTGSGSGTLRLDVDDDNTIVDSIPNQLGGGTEGDGDFTTGEVYTIDKGAPVLQAFSRHVPTGENTNANTLVFRATFSEDVQNVSPDDFIVNSGTTAGITQVVAFSDDTYDITVSGGDLAGYNGTVGLNVAGTQDITDLYGNTLATAEPSTDETYIVDNSAPLVDSIVRTITTSPTSSPLVYFEVTFSKDVTGVDTSDFSLAVTGLTGTSIDSISGSGDTYTLTVDTGTGTGTIRLDLADDDSIEDLAGNPLGGSGTGIGDFSNGETYVIDRTGPTVTLAANAVPGATSVIVQGFSTLRIEFDEAVLHDGSAQAANNAINYLLFQAGLNGVFDTPDCEAVTHPNSYDDIFLPIGPAIYSDGGGSGPFQVTLTVNSGTALPFGEYRLHICGTTSIEDLSGNELNGGTSDAVVTFTIIEPTLPATGFAPSATTILPAQPENLAYQDMDGMWLEIPSLGVEQPIVGVPALDNEWDLTWLGRSVGYLEGSAYPTWSGNSVLTAHVYDASGAPGPFQQLGELGWGDQVVIRSGDLQYIYEVRTVQQFARPEDLSAVTRHEDLDWVTLITCRGYNEDTGTYRWRTVVRAVRIAVR
ncbi:MAG: sortase [Anaerolineales bacterium]|nr:sortase [Anaerolineales bacterium]